MICYVASYYMNRQLNTGICEIFEWSTIIKSIGIALY